MHSLTTIWSSFVLLEPLGCQDDHKNCEYWASLDECKKNPDYMLKNCRKSCNICSGRLSNGVEFNRLLEIQQQLTLLTAVVV